MLKPAVSFVVGKGEESCPLGANVPLIVVRCPLAHVRRLRVDDLLTQRGRLPDMNASSRCSTTSQAQYE